MPMMSSRVLVALLGLVVASAGTGCSEALSAERLAPQLEDARRSVEAKDVEIRAYQAQVATLVQQLHDGQQRSDALEKELRAQIQELVASNATLKERLKPTESAELAIAALGGPGARLDNATLDAVRRLFAASEARNAQILAELRRIARANSASAGDGASAKPRQGPPDPWGFGARK
jgi:TolA-binding protein